MSKQNDKEKGKHKNKKKRVLNKNKLKKLKGGIASATADETVNLSCGQGLCKTPPPGPGNNCY